MRDNTRSSPRPLLPTLLVLLGGGFLATSLVSYCAALESIRNGIVNTGIQKDPARPVLIVSMMARDTFVRDWVMNGEQDALQMTRYLREVQDHHGTIASSFVSDQTRTCYPSRGVLKGVRLEPGTPPRQVPA